MAIPQHNYVGYGNWSETGVLGRGMFKNHGLTQPWFMNHRSTTLDTEQCPVASSQRGENHCNEQNAHD